MTVSLTEEKTEAIIVSIRTILQEKFPTIRHVCQIIGKILATAPANAYARLHVTNLMLERDQALQNSDQDYDQVMALSNIVKDDLELQIERLPLAITPLHRATPNMVIFTDASDDGWGVHSLQSGSFGGRWSDEEYDWHINTQETMAIWLAIQYILRNISNIHVRIRCDNTTAIAAVRKQGDLNNSCRNQITRDIWEFIIVRNIWLSITRIAGVDNVLADEASIVFIESEETSMSRDMFQRIISIFGEPEIDLFASRLNYKLHTYAAWKPDPGAIIIDSLAEHWGWWKFVYCFPPTCLIARTIQKIQFEYIHGLLVVPENRMAVWYSVMRRIQIGDHFNFLVNEDNLHNIQDFHFHKEGSLMRVIRF